MTDSTWISHENQENEAVDSPLRVFKLPSPNTSVSKDGPSLRIPNKPEPSFEGDRFIPLRAINEDDELSETYERKIEIESRPPLNLYDDSGIESQNQNNNNQQTQPTNQNNEMCSGENLRKYNILL